MRPNSETGGCGTARGPSPARLRTARRLRCRCSSSIHVDEVDDEKTPEVPQPDLTRDLGDASRLDAKTVSSSVLLADVLPGVDVDRDERFGLVDDDRASRGQTHAALQGVLDLRLDPERLEQRLGRAGSAPDGNEGGARRRRGIPRAACGSPRRRRGSPRSPSPTRSRTRAQREVELPVQSGRRRGVVPALPLDARGEVEEVPMVRGQLGRRGPERRRAGDEPSVAGETPRGSGAGARAPTSSVIRREIADLAHARKVDERAPGQ